MKKLLAFLLSAFIGCSNPIIEESPRGSNVIFNFKGSGDVNIKPNIMMDGTICGPMCMDITLPLEVVFKWSCSFTEGGTTSIQVRNCNNGNVLTEVNPDWRINAIDYFIDIDLGSN